MNHTVDGRISWHSRGFVNIERTKLNVMNKQQFERFLQTYLDTVASYLKSQHEPIEQKRLSVTYLIRGLIAVCLATLFGSGLVLWGGVILALATSWCVLLALYYGYWSIRENVGQKNLRIAHQVAYGGDTGKEQLTGLIDMHAELQAYADEHPAELRDFLPSNIWGDMYEVLWRRIAEGDTTSLWNPGLNWMETYTNDWFVLDQFFVFSIDKCLFFIIYCSSPVQKNVHYSKRKFRNELWDTFLETSPFRLGRLAT